MDAGPMKRPGTGSPDLRKLEPMTEVLSADYLEYYGLLPLEIVNGTVHTGTWMEEVDTQALDDFRRLFLAEPLLVPIPEAEGRQAIHRVYGRDPMDLDGSLDDLDLPQIDLGDELALDDLVSLANEAPVIRLVNLTLLQALEARASDVHIESYADEIRVRYRVDGVLLDQPSPPQRMAPAIVSRLKIMAELDIAERRIPQDGRIRLKLQSRQVDVRVSTLPSLHGESVVLRLLDKDRGRIELEDLGMSSATLEALLGVIRKPHGIVLATGPTGSGKTTTLYAAIDRIRTGSEKILTVEDPVEYELEGVPQVAVNERVGLTFASALRALLRQDPDVLLVGEIRDRETAEIATHAALTGHLVLSTLHTNDAPSAITRLLDLGVPAYLVASTVEAVLAQRLVRRVCQSCSESVPLKSNTRRALGAGPESLEMVRRGKGCEQCLETGFLGRTGLYEILVMDDELRAEVQAVRGSQHIRTLATTKGMRTLREDGVRLVSAGLTTPEEVLRITA